MSKVSSFEQTFRKIGDLGDHAHKFTRGDHLAHFYEDKNALIESVCNYVLPGISRGDGIILISNEAHLKAIEHALERRSIDVAKGKAAGQILQINAEETLSRIMSDGLPHPGKFRKVIGEVIENMHKKFPRIRAYGEMVNLLWDKENLEGTIQLEKLWNNLAAEYSFSLLCAYSQDELRTKNGMGFDQICSCHTHIISTKGELNFKFEGLPH